MLVSDSLTDSLPFSKLDWCDPGAWRWDVSDEECVGNSLLRIQKLRFGHKTYFWSDFKHFGQDFEIEV